MRKTTSLVIVCVLMILGLTVVASRAQINAPASPVASVYQLDSVHSHVGFKIQHLGVSYTYGRFNEVTGSFTCDAAKPQETHFDITAKTESIDTNNQRRDTHLKGPDFFNAKLYPEIKFVSTSITPGEKDTLKVKGNLSLHGVTRPIEVELQKVGEKTDPRAGSRCGFDATFKIKRSDFGMTYMIDNGGAGDEVTIMVGLEGQKR